MYTLPTSSSNFYTNSYGFRQFSSIQSSLWIKLCCGRSNRHYVQSFQAFAVGRRCYSDNDCNFREKCKNVTRGLKKLMALEEKGINYDFGGMNEVGFMLNMLSNELYGQYFCVKKKINRVVKKPTVEEIDISEASIKCRSKKKIVESFVCHLKQGDSKRAGRIKMKEESKEFLGETRRKNENQEQKYLFNKNFSSEYDSDLNKGKFSLDLLSSGYKSDRKRMNEDVGKEGQAQEDFRDNCEVNSANVIGDKNSSSIHCDFRKESEKSLTDVLSIKNSESRKGTKEKATKFSTIQINGYDDMHIKSKKSTELDVEKKQPGDRGSIQSENKTKYKQLDEIPDTRSSDVRNSHGSEEKVRTKMEEDFSSEIICSNYTEDKVRFGRLKSDVQQDNRTLKTESVDEEQNNSKILVQHNSGDSETLKFNEPLVHEPSGEETSQRILGTSYNAVAALEKSVTVKRFDEWEEGINFQKEQQNIDEMFMNEALCEARKAADNLEVPVGAVLVHNGRIIARGCNEVEELRDCTAHAEMICIRKASNLLQNWRLSETTLYVTLEPCPMCAGAILQARIDTVVWGAPNKLLGADGSWIRIFPNRDRGNGLELIGDVPAAPVHPFHPDMIIRRGVLRSECADIMRQFFKLRRKMEKNPEPELSPSCLPISLFPSMFITKIHQLFLIIFCL